MDFLCVYIAEAHAKDKWPLGRHVELTTHANFAERVSASDILRDKYNLKVKIMYDTMADEFDQAYAVWPERYFIVKDGLMVRVYSPTTDFGFDREEMRRDIENSVSLGTKLMVKMGELVGM